MKRIFVIAATIVTLGSFNVLHAQQPAAPATTATAPAKTKKAKVDPVEKRTAYLKKHLNLNDTQAGQVKDLLTQERADALKVKQDSTLDKKTKKEHLVALKKEYNDKLNGVFTPEQQKSYAAMQEAKKQKAAEKAAAKKAAAATAPATAPAAH